MDKRVAERIAAGEVVDRPASVVKELLENALDAASGRVSVAIREGGKSFIKVSDDGCGMSGEDLLLAVQRFATSKISEWEDMDNLYTLGFRGEALPSIAAVSRLEINSARAGDLEGSRLSMEGPEEPRIAPAAAVPGTSITVKDLFFNTPARLKFLRSAGAEAAQITELVGRMAAAWPEVAFQLVSNGKEVFNFGADMTSDRRLAALWKLNAGDFIPVFGRCAGVSADGFVARPQFSKTTRNYQLFVMNGRIIRSQSLSQALSEGFAPLIAHGRFPMGMIRLSVDPAFVDVNVHPTKLEVRFADPRPVFSAVYHAVREALENAGADSVSEKHFELLAERAAQADAEEVIYDPEESLPPADPPIPRRSGENGKASASALSAAAHSPVSESAAGEAGKASERGEGAEFFVSTPEKCGGAKSVSRLFEDKRTESAAAGSAAEPASEKNSAALVSVNRALSEASGFPAQPLLAGLDDGSREPFKVLGQVYRTFIVGIMEGKLWLVDQHTAQERINYERFGSIRILSERSQGLLVPEIFSVSPSAEAFFGENADIFKEYGFEAEIFGYGKIAVRGVPAALPYQKAASAFRELLEELAGEKLSVKNTAAETLRERVRAMASCKSAVKAGELLSMEAMSALVNAMLKVEHSRYCPHGRPTRVILELDMLERLFHRK